MTHDKYEELHFLKILLDRTDSPKKWHTKDELILAARTARMPADRAYAIFDSLKKGEYINEADDPKKEGDKIYNIADAGRWYYGHLVIEEQKDALDLKLKDISIRNIKTTRIIAWASLIISIAIGGVQVIRYVEEKVSPKYSIQEKETKELLQSQRDISTHLQTLQQTIYHADTSVKN